MKDVEGLFAAYGFTVQSRDPQQKKIRFSSAKTFIDLWQGKKGATIGIYNPETAMMGYRKKVDLNQIEEILLKLK